MQIINFYLRKNNLAKEKFPCECVCVCSKRVRAFNLIFEKDRERKNEKEGASEYLFESMQTRYNWNHLSHYLYLFRSRTIESSTHTYYIWRFLFRRAKLSQNTHTHIHTWIYFGKIYCLCDFRNRLSAGLTINFA